MRCWRVHKSGNKLLGRVSLRNQSQIWSFSLVRMAPSREGAMLDSGQDDTNVLNHRSSSTYGCRSCGANHRTRHIRPHGRLHARDHRTGAFGGQWHAPSAHRFGRYGERIHGRGARSRGERVGTHRHAGDAPVPRRRGPGFADRHRQRQAASERLYAQWHVAEHHGTRRDLAVAPRIPAPRDRMDARLAWREACSGTTWVP